MKKTKTLFVRILTLLVICRAGLASAGVVVLKVVDQNGQQIPGSRLNVLSQNVDTGDSFLLPEGIQSFIVLPGLRGSPSTTTELYRTESQEVTPETTELVFEWITSTYTIRVQDQHGVDIPASKVTATGTPQTFNAGDPVTLPITDESVYPTMSGAYKDGYYTILIPGLRGSPSSTTDLYRTEGNLELSSVPAEFVFEWITSTYTVRVQDQHGVDIPASKYQTAGPSTPIMAGEFVTLPITDESVYPTMLGFYKDGYYTYLIPGLRGFSGSTTELYRGEGHLELSVAPTEFVFEWITSTYTVRVQDQHGADIAASRFQAPGPPQVLNAGEPVTLPITDESVYPTMVGGYKDGYYTLLLPGINGHPITTTELYRIEGNLELPVEPTEFVFEWIRFECALEVRNAGNTPVGGSDLILPAYHPDFVPGQPMPILVNDRATYPTIGGAYASFDMGYPITVVPGDIAPASSTLGFTALASGEFSPASFVIGGKTYILAFDGCDDCSPPEIENLTAPTAPLVLGTAVTASAHFAAADNGSGRTCMFSWDDGSPNTVTSAAAAICSANHTYGVPGVYRVTVTASNDCGATDMAIFEFIVVYDPNGGFVTGGGWITSPEGAFTANPSLMGKANFGFVSKYQKGANVPTGNTEFQFKAGDLNFHSTSYDWLVVAGAKAKYKGSGTINGSGDYAFMLTATDGQVSGGGGADRFRIKIWNKSGGGVIYDNQLNDPDTADATQAIAGGSIVVHKL